SMPALSIREPRKSIVPRPGHGSVRDGDGRGAGRHVAARVAAAVAGEVHSIVRAVAPALAVGGSLTMVPERSTPTAVSASSIDPSTALLGSEPLPSIAIRGVTASRRLLSRTVPC